MTAFFIIGIIITIAIAFFLVRKIENNTYRVCIFIANIIVLVLFIASGSAVSFVKKNLDAFVKPFLSCIPCQKTFPRKEDRKSCILSEKIYNGISAYFPPEKYVFSVAGNSGKKLTT